MKPRADNYLSLKQAVLASDVAEKHVKNWIDRDEVTFDADATRGDGHRRYSELDCVRMALISRLKRFGYEGDTAAKEIENVIREVCDAWKIRYYPKRDNITIVDALRKIVVIFYLSGPFVALTAEQAKKLHPEELKQREERLRDHVIHIKRKIKNLAKFYKPLTDIPAEADVRLVVDVAAIVDGIYQRLETITKD